MKSVAAARAAFEYRNLAGISLLCLLLSCPAWAAEPPAGPSPHVLFVFAGDPDRKGNDFLLAIDADPASAGYGRMLSSADTGFRSVRPHHTEYTMPAGGKLFANDHDSGRTFIFDVRDPLHPAIVTSFDDMAGFEHPHSFLRLPNGNVLASFQHRRHTMPALEPGKSGGLVEIDDRANVVRSASSLDAAFTNALLTPYSLIVLPEIDRVLSTNSSMHLDDIFSGATYQVWRLSDLKLLRTEYFDVGENRYAHVGPQEARRGPDGSVFVQTLSCGLERITGIERDAPVAKLVYTFPGNWCGVPTVVGHYLIESVPEIHGFVVLDIADGSNPVEVSRLRVSESFFPHWTSWDPSTGRVVAPPGKPDDNRLYLLRLDQATGRLTLDDAFRDSDGRPGVSFAERQWPHGWKGPGLPHGAVFSR